MMISGCITNSATNGVQIQATPVPETGLPTTASTVPPANDTTTVSPVPPAGNKTINASPDPVSRLPPAVFFTYVPPYGSDDNVTGRVTDVDPSKYKLAILANNYGWWNEPSADSPLTTINSDGSWECDISSGGGDNATEIDAFLVPAEFNMPIVTGRYGLPQELKSGAITCNGVNRKPKNH